MKLQRWRRLIDVQIFLSRLIMADKNLFVLINGQMKNRILDLLMPRITHLGGAIFTLASLASFIIFFEGNLRIWSIEAIISLTVSHIIVQIIKKIYRRNRPYLDILDTKTFPNPLIDYSFPSGHTTSSFAIVTVFVLNFPSISLILIPLAIIIGISRIYLGLHYPTDVVFGALLGLITSVMVVDYVNKFQLFL